MWNKPWKYREGIAISVGLLITGALLQVSIGPVEWLVFMWPANIIALAILIVALGLFYALRSKVYLFKFMTQVEAAVPALAAASVLTIIMGLSRQVPEGRPAELLAFRFHLSLEHCNCSRGGYPTAYALPEAIYSFAHQPLRIVCLRNLRYIRFCRYATSQDVLRRR